MLLSHAGLYGIGPVWFTTSLGYEAAQDMSELSLALSC